jgi:hypothetical protein
MTADPSPELEALRMAVPSCTLDEAGLRGQRERRALLAPAVTAAERRGDTLAIRFAADFNRSALDELVRVERECCPFFVFQFDDEERLLKVSVDDASHAPALDAIASLFGTR